MLLSDTVLFALCLVTVSAILLILVYFIFTLSDLECDYLNAQECCTKLNYWLLPKYIGHGFVTFMQLMLESTTLFVIYLFVFVVLSVEYFRTPSGSLGVYDPAEIHNRGMLKKHMQTVLYNIVFYLVFFFIYLYCFILELLKGNPFPKNSDEEIVTTLH